MKNNFQNPNQENGFIQINNLINLKNLVAKRISKSSKSNILSKKSWKSFKNISKNLNNLRENLKNLRKNKEMSKMFLLKKILQDLNLCPFLRKLFNPGFFGFRRIEPHGNFKFQISIKSNLDSKGMRKRESFQECGKTRLSWWSLWSRRPTLDVLLLLECWPCTLPTVIVRGGVNFRILGNFAPN